MPFPQPTSRIFSFIWISFEITNKSFLEENKSDVEKVVKSFKKGYEFSIRNPQESISSLISIAGEEIVEEDVERAGVELLIPMWHSNNLPFGHQDLYKWEETYEWMYQNNFLEKELIIENLFIDEFSN